MELAISLLALFATFYQLYLQRQHNEKSLKPLVQIDLTDRKNLIAVHIRNNGAGPFILKSLTFIVDGQSHSNIEECLTFPSRSYHAVPITPANEKVLMPAASMDVFAIQLAESDDSELANEVRKQLAALTLKVDGQDIYNNKIVVKRGLRWFIKYLETHSAER